MFTFCIIAGIEKIKGNKKARFSEKKRAGILSELQADWFDLCLDATAGDGGQ